MEKHRNISGTGRYRFLTVPAAVLLAVVLPFSAGIHAAAAPASGNEIKQLVPVGHTVGVKLFTDGVMVIGVAMVDTQSGKLSPALDAGLAEGDIITHIGDSKVNTIEQVIQAVQTQEELTVRLRRKGKPVQVKVKSVKCKTDESYKLGLWIRDSIAGIGTMTFYDPQNKVFGALGHGISDVDTQELMPLASGAIMYSTVTDVRMGVSGEPGELRGQFNLDEDAGSLYANSESGIFGNLTDISLVKNSKAVYLATNNEIKTGAATILSNVSGDTVEEYDVEIVKIYAQAEEPSRNMMIRITDERLLAKTGGIVQGMSGSPILQNGKLIGAVTHVLVNDPKRGYGIFIDNMLKEAYSEGQAAA